MAIKAQIQEVFDSTIRPMVARHKGDVELVEVDENTGIVQVRFQGMCVGCPMAYMTLKAGIEAELMDKVPEVREVVAVDEDGNPLEENEEDEDLNDWGKEA